jgi:hypothetical protein
MTEKITWREDPPNSETFVAYVNEIGVGLASRTLNNINGKWLGYYITSTQITPLLNDIQQPKLFEELSEAKAAVETWINEQ